MDKKKYIVSGRFSGERGCMVEANSASEAIKIARKEPVQKWKVLQLCVRGIHTARQLKDRSTPMKDQLKTEIEAAFADAGE